MTVASARSNLTFVSTMSAEEVATLKANIQNELQEIIRIQHLIQTELDHLNTISKDGGFLETAIMEGTEAMKKLANVAKIPLDANTLSKFQEIKENLTMEVCFEDMKLKEQNLP